MRDQCSLAKKVTVILFKSVMEYVNGKLLEFTDKLTTVMETLLAPTFFNKESIMKRKIQFEHLNISAKEVAKYDIRKIKRSTVHEILERIHKQKMKKYHHNYCPDAVYRLMENKCILFSNATHDLILGKIFTKMMRIYEQKNCDFMDFYKISDFDPIKIMYARNQISEC